MKKSLLILCMLIIASFSASSQCIPDPAITQPGIYPDTITNLPSGTTGVFYSTDIQLRVLTDTFASGFNVDVVNITIDSVGGLPSGFSYACTPSNCVFPGGSNGCIRLSGTNNNAGAYNLTVYVTLNGLVFGSFPVSQPATITGYTIVLDAPAVPVAAFSASATSLCKGEEITFSDLSSNSPDTWTWDFPGGTPASSSAQNPVVTYSTPGTYSVTLTVSSPAGSDAVTLTNYITVNDRPAAQITPGGVVKFCPGEATTLSASSGTGYTYQWYKYGVLLNGETNQTLTVSTGGQFKVKVTDASTGCTKPSPYRLVRQHPKPNVAIAAAGATQFCFGGSVNLVATTGITNTVQWTKGGVDIQGASSNVFLATESGFYKAVVTSQNGCTRISNGISVKAWPLPNAGITQSGPLAFCQGDSVVLSVINYDPLNQYQWEESLQAITNQNGQDYTANTAGSYTFLARSPEGCTKRSQPRVVSITCRESLISEVSTNFMSVYPNPTSGQITVDLTIAVTEQVTVGIYDVLGRLQMYLVNNEIAAGQYSLTTDLSSLPKGVYFVQMRGSKKVDVTRILVE